MSCPKLTNDEITETRPMETYDPSSSVTSDAVWRSWHDGSFFLDFVLTIYMKIVIMLVFLAWLRTFTLDVIERAVWTPIRRVLGARRAFGRIRRMLRPFGNILLKGAFLGLLPFAGGKVTEPTNVTANATNFITSYTAEWWTGVTNFTNEILGVANEQNWLSPFWPFWESLRKSAIYTSL